MCVRVQQGIREGTWSRPHINTAKNLGKLGKAEKIYQRVLQKYQSTFGTDHASTFDTVDDLGHGRDTVHMELVRER